MALKCFQAAAIAAAIISACPALTAKAAPIESYAKLPAIESVEISAAGDKLAYIRGSEGKRHLVIQSLQGEVVSTVDVSGYKVRTLSWADPNHVLVTTTATGAIDDDRFLAIKGEFLIIYSFNIGTGKVVRLMQGNRNESLNVAFSGATPGVFKGKPVAYLMGYTNEGAGRYDVYRVDLDTGLGVVHQMGSKEFNDFVVTREGDLAARSFRGVGGRWRLEVANGKTWVQASSAESGTIDTPGLPGFGRSLDTVLTAKDNPEADHWELVEVDRTTGKYGAPFGPKVVADTLIYARDGRLVGLGYTDIYPEYEFYDAGLQAAWQLISRAFDGKVVELASWSEDLSTLVISVEGEGEPGAWYVVQPAAKSVRRIGSAYPDLKPQDVAEIRIVRYKAADGTPISGYLTLPRGKDAKNLPLIALPHGGPAARDYARFDFWAQALASRGYAVFQPNFRGSAGFGGKFLTAGHGEMGRKMQTDISDGVRTLARAGMIDPKRVCIAGGSYGGYAALAGVTLEQGVYRCAVSVAGVSDLGLMLDNEALSSGGSNSRTVGYWKRFIGAASSKDPMLATISPARLADRSSVPVLLIHGKDDTVVKYDQSVAMARALKAANRPVEFITLSDEDHWLSREPTRVQALKAMSDFLEKHNPPN